MRLIFVSSPQQEFAHERKELCYFILTDPYLKQYFDVFLFENLPATQQDPAQNYRNKVEECSIYLGLFGKSYGTPHDGGISATEREYDYATELVKDRVVYLKILAAGTRRERKMHALVERAKQEVTYRSFETLDELKLKVMQSLLYWQQESLSNKKGRK